MIRRVLAGLVVAVSAAGCGEERTGVPDHPLPPPDKADRKKHAIEPGETPTSVKRAAFEGK